MRFDLVAPTQIVFGAGRLDELGALVRPLGSRALVVSLSRTLARAGVVARVRHLLEAAGIATTPLSADAFGSLEPNVIDVERSAALARADGRDLVVGLGGGGSIDAAKAIAALAANPGGALDYLEVVGRGRPLERPALPVVAIPTTAGAGAEVTRNAVLLSPDHAMKASLRHPSLYPRVALVDPILMLTMPPALTASTGLDALTQCLEAFVSVRANPFSDGLALEGIALAAGALPRAHRDGDDLAARAEMAIAATLSGMALANAGLGAVHGFAAALGGRYPIPHGVACAALLAPVAAANARALRERDPHGPGLVRYRRAAAAALPRQTDRGAAVDALVDWLDGLSRALQVPPLRAYDVAATDLPDLVDAALRASSTRGNPIQLTADEMAAALGAAL